MCCIDLPAPADLHLLVSVLSLDIGFTSHSGRDPGLPFSDAPEGRPQLVKKVRQRVLVVDDEGIVADTVADVLNRNGYEAVAVYGGKEALRTARALCPDIILCDILMPDLNGVEAAKKLRCACPGARIILFSGQAGSSQLEERAQGYQFETLVKPVHPRELLRKLTAR